MSNYAQKLFDVSGKVVVVTGGGAGIGLMITNGFVKAGAKVFISSRKKDVIEKVARDLTAEGPGECHAVASDLSTKDGCKHLVSELQKTFGVTGVHVLVNNSGANWGAPLEEYPEQAWEKLSLQLFNLNVKSVFHLTVALLPMLRAVASKDDPARVINIGSINGFTIPSLETYAYTSSKAALHQLSNHLAVRLGPSNITVNTIAAGPFPSHMMKATLDKFGDAIAARVPLKKIGDAEDIAGTCIYLSSSAGKWTTGSILTLAGGSHLTSAL